MQPSTQNAPLIDRLAAEYVLGTLRGPARRRFARWRGQHALVAESCAAWEQRLAGFGQSVPAVLPPARVWLAIEQGLGLAGNQRLWRAVAAVAVLGLLGALAANLYTTGSMRTPDEIADIGPEGGTVQWHIEIYAGERRLLMRAPGTAQRAAGRDFELWVLPADGSQAISLGVMPVRGERAARLTATQAMALMAGARLAVSVEPSGGSPTGQATGPVVFVAPLRGAG